MIKRKKITLWILIFAVILLIGGESTWKIHHQKHHIIKSTPTLFLHGWGSSVNAEHQMTHAALKAKATNSITQAIVNPQGKVKLIGNIPSNAKNPIIEIGFQNNRNINFHENGQWLKNVITTLQKVYQIKKINLVGHSMGNMAIAYYLLDNYQNKGLPKLLKQVDIAGHYDGIIGQNDQPNLTKLDAKGKPNRVDKNYQTLLKLRDVFPNHQVKVLNIFGDKNDGTHSDGDVTNASAKSLRYLVADRALSYSEKKIIGPNGQHSRLHENKAVDQILINFLWK